jgi:hypothetical protein
MDVFMLIVALPLWAIITIALAGVVIGMFLLMAAVMLLGRGEKSMPVEVAAETVVDAAKAITLEKTVTKEPYKPMPPIRQHHWYYVKGVDGRFATLREAFVALGENPPKTLDWKKLPHAIRSRITRTPVDAQHPEPQPDNIAISEAKAAPMVVAKAGEQDNNGVIRKPIGNGCFVTVKKKGKK